MTKKRTFEIQRSLKNQTQGDPVQKKREEVLANQNQDQENLKKKKQEQETRTKKQETYFSGKCTD